MNITSDTLFHFTNSRKNLESILENRFHPTYCKEDIKFGKSLSHSIYFPMVCFCDIPLFLSKNHIGSYGNFGIGMTKEWGIKNKLNPVLYIENNSKLANNIYDSLKLLQKTLKNANVLIDELKEITQKSDDSAKIINLLDKLHDYSDSSVEMFRYIKNYQSDLKRKNKTISNYRFYDEREWRYVPEKRNNSQWMLNEKEYKEYRKKSVEKPLINDISLNFKSSDIKYLIVKSEKDIPKLIRKISSVKNLANTADEIEILTTKILTVDQLKNDF